MDDFASPSLSSATNKVVPRISLGLPSFSITPLMLTSKALTDGHPYLPLIAHSRQKKISQEDAIAEMSSTWVPAGEFSRFPILPTEIRLYIWSLAIPKRRYISIKLQKDILMGGKNIILLPQSSTRRISAILQVNQEARELAEKVFTPILSWKGIFYVNWESDYFLVDWADRFTIIERWSTKGAIQRKARNLIMMAPFAPATTYTFHTHKFLTKLFDKLVDVRCVLYKTASHSSTQLDYFLLQLPAAQEGFCMKYFLDMERLERDWCQCFAHMKSSDMCDFRKAKGLVDSISDQDLVEWAMDFRI